MKLKPIQSPIARLSRALLATAVALALLAGVGPLPSARAANLCVNPSGANGCHTTIQDAIDHANPNDTIAVGAGTYGEHLTLDKTPLTIDGAGSDVTFVDGTGTGQVVTISVGNQETITGITLKNGLDNAGLGGGGIHDDGQSLDLSDVVLTNNATTGYGGGLYVNGGTATLTNVTIAGSNGSAAGFGGGGIYNATGATLTLTTGTLSGNTALVGGAIQNEGTMTVTDVTIASNSGGSNGQDAGIYNDSGGTLTLVNTTFVGNDAAYNAGALDNFGTATLTNVTISGNQGASGGGIANLGSGTVTLKNTIVANNLPANCSGTFTSEGHNLSTDTTCISSSPSAGDQVVADPKLGALHQNGGPTQPMALLPYSPAIDAGDDAGCPATDQRGTTRPQGKTCDVGAYEFVPPTLALSPPTMTLIPGTGATATVTIGSTQSSTTLVTLASSNGTVASVPPSVTIPTNQTSATFQVSAVRPGGSVTITATLPAGLGGTSATLSVTVQDRFYFPYVPN